MKSLLTLACLSLLVLVSNPVCAQDTETKPPPTAHSSFGMKAHYGAAIVTTEGMGSGVESETGAAWSLGVFWTYSSGGLISFAVQPELMYVSETGTLNYSGIAGSTIKAESIRLPILLKMELFNRALIQPSVYAGPSFGYVVNGTSTVGTITSDIDGLNTFQVGLAMGVDVTVLNFFVVDFRYNLGLTDLAEQSFNGYTASMKMSSFRIGLGLRF